MRTTFDLKYMIALAVSVSGLWGGLKPCCWARAGPPGLASRRPSGSAVTPRFPYNLF